MLFVTFDYHPSFFLDCADSETITKPTAQAMHDVGK